MRQFDREDLTAEYHRGLAEGRAQGLKMAEEACMALERKKWEVFAQVMREGGEVTSVGPLECIQAIKRLS